MITVKQLMQTDNSSSPDGKHWEPALSYQCRTFGEKIKDVLTVRRGTATAIRQTTEADIRDKNYDNN